MVDLAAQVYPAAKETQEAQDFQESQVLKVTSADAKRKKIQQIDKREVKST